ncbi:MAG: TrmH family RNA methyltransferase [Phycisphaerales bacterium]
MKTDRPSSKGPTRAGPATRGGTRPRAGSASDAPDDFASNIQHQRSLDPLADAYNSITIYGKRSVQEALDEPTVEVLGVRVARELPGEYRERLSSLCRAKSAPLELRSFREIGAFTADPRNDQGVAARIRLKKAVELADFLESVKGQGSREPAHVIALDGVTNPQNVGMIVRSAVASGTRAVLWPSAGAPWVDALIVKSSAGTVLRCPIVRCRLLSDALAEMKGSGFRLVGLDMSGNTSLYDLKPTHRTIAVIGGETTGLSPSTLELLDERVSIPMDPRAKVDSLNAAVAASLLCFELARKRAAATR